MRILLIAENWPPRRGGIENYLTHLAAGLAARGHAVTAIVPQVKEEGAFSIPGVDISRQRFFWPLMRPAWLPLFISLWRRVKRERPDVVISGKALFEGRIGYYLKRHLDIPYIVCTYAMEIETWAASRQRRALERVIREAARVVHINDVTAKRLAELGAEKKQLLKITPGVDERFLRAVHGELIAGTLRHYQITQPYILSVGRLIPRKGFDLLIEAFSRLDQIHHGDVQLVIVGEGPEQERLEALARQEYIHSRVRIVSDVPDNHLPALYSGAAVFALTPRDLGTDYEGFGIVYLEAAACGVPAVATNTGGAQEAVVHEETGLVTEPEPAAVAAALTQLLVDEEKREELGAAAREQVRSSHQWADKILILEEHLSQL